MVSQILVNDGSSNGLELPFDRNLNKYIDGLAQERSFAKC